MEYDDESNQTSYRTPGISIFETGSSPLGLQGKQRVSIHVEAYCEAEACEPEIVDVVFSRDGDSEAWMDLRNLSMEMDGETLQWRESSRQESTVRILPGEFTRVSLSLDQFSRMAAAQTVSGSLGGVPFRLSYSERHSFRDLLARFGGS